MNPLLISLALIMVPASNAGFSQRQKAGLIASDTAEGQKYLHQLSPQLLAAMKEYVPPKPSSEETPASFVFVAYVSPDGVISNPQVQPSIALTEHFCREFSKKILPKPPESNTGPEGYPITLEIALKYPK